MKVRNTDIEPVTRAPATRRKRSANHRELFGAEKANAIARPRPGQPGIRAVIAVLHDTEKDE